MTLNVDLTFLVPGIGEVSCSGTIAELEPEPSEAPANVVADWLGHVSPAELERFAWAAQEATGEEYTTVVLAVLAKWASGTP